MHMTITRVLPEDNTYLDGEFRVNSGLIDVRLRACSIQDKINWKNALALAKKSGKEKSQHNASGLRKLTTSKSQRVLREANDFACRLSTTRKPTGEQAECASDQSSFIPLQMPWSEVLNLSFNTAIFSNSNDYIAELGNIYGAKALIDQALSAIIPQIQNYRSLAAHVEQLMDALDDLKAASRKCVKEMESQRRNMYSVAKKMVVLRDQIRHHSVKDAALKQPAMRRPRPLQ
jgi:hypothetical protein